MNDAVGKYARIERERKWLVARFPGAFDPSQQHSFIEDRYLINTRLRLRRMTDSVTGEVQHKLALKRLLVSGDLSRVAITNLYVSPAEYELLLVHPAHLLSKQRYRLGLPNGLLVSLDLFRSTGVSPVFFERNTGKMPVLQKSLQALSPMHGRDARVTSGPSELLEVEFPSDEAMSAFRVPEWFGDEVTDDAEFTGVAIAR